MYSAVCFDLFETLISEFDPDWKPEPTLEDRLNLAGRRWQPEWQKIRSRLAVGDIADYRDAVQELARAMGGHVSPDLAQELYRDRLAAKRRPFERAGGEVLEGLRRMRAWGLKLAVISNCSPEDVAAWPDCRLAELFDAAVFSFRVGFAKPHPDIYLSACRQLEVDPADCLFIGDGGSDELRGAESAGFTVYQAAWYLRDWPSWKKRGKNPQGRYPVLGSIDEVLLVIDQARHQ